MARQRARLSAGQAKRKLGLRVRELRRERGWTQEQAAAKLDIAVENYAHVEQGRRLVRIDTLVNFANLFGVTIADLFAEPENTIVRRGRPPRKRD